MRLFLQALSLMTAIPVRVAWDEQAPAGRIMRYFPLVGAFLGGLLAAAGLLLVFSPWCARVPLFAGALVVALWAALTGGLHLDGWADCCDALFVPVSREKRFAILKDPHIGSFGVIGLVLLLVIKAAAAQAIIVSAHSQARLLAPLLLAPVLARWVMVAVAWLFPLAKPDGMAAWFRQGLGPREFLIATATAAILVAPLGVAGVVLLLIALLAGLLLARLATQRLGGVTGDVYGAAIEWTETVVLVAASLVA